MHGIPSALLNPVGQAERCFVKRGTWGAREYLVSCVNAIRGSRDPVAGACCRSHLQNYHDITLFRAYEGPEGRGEGEGGMCQPVQGPWHGNRRVLGGTPPPAGS